MTKTNLNHSFFIVLYQLGNSFECAQCVRSFRSRAAACRCGSVVMTLKLRRPAPSGHAGQNVVMPI